MDRKKRLLQTITRVRIHVTLERLFLNMQKGLLYAVLSACIVLIVSRLFVLPYYAYVAVAAASIAFVAMLAKTIIDRTTKLEALHRLDSYYPYNELVTALTNDQEDNPLVQSLLKRASDGKEQAFQLFKQRQKQLLFPKTISITVGLSALLLVLTIFPAATQQEAKVVEEERAITKEIHKNIDKLQKKELSEQAKKELQELKKKLKETENAEQALRELVKKQKELNLEENKLQQKQHITNQNGEGLTAKETKRLSELKELNSELAKSASSAVGSLSKLGKPVDLSLQNTIANALNNSQANASTGQNGSANGQSSNGAGQGQAGQNNGASQGNNQKNGSGNGNQGTSNKGANGQGSGSGNGSGNGQGNSNGNGNGSGSGIGSGQGAGQGGGAGIGMGHRNLLAIPSRLGGSSDTTVDGGKLGDGKPIEEKGAVPTTKGEIRPYQEVVGSYKDSYMKSTDRLQLPNDLQQMVQSYFTSIESTN